MEEKRRIVEKREKRKTRKEGIRKEISRILSVHPSWWGEVNSDSESEDEAEDEDEHIYVCAFVLSMATADPRNRRQFQIIVLCWFFPRPLYHISSTR